MLPMVVLFMLAADGPPAPNAVEEAGLRQLTSVKRVYVDRLTGGETAAQMRDILISAMNGSKLFVLTENQERADATLRGAAEDMVSTETHSSTDSLNAHGKAGTGRSSNTTRSSSASGSAYAGFSLGENESDHSTDRRHEAMASVRLVNKDGDVIWSTTQES